MFLHQLALTLAVFRCKIRLGLLALLRHPMGAGSLIPSLNLGIFDDIRRYASHFDTDLAGRHVSRRMVTASSISTDDDYPPALINRIYNFFRKTGALLLSGNGRPYDISLIRIIAS